VGSVCLSYWQKWLLLVNFALGLDYGGSDSRGDSSETLDGLSHRRRRFLFWQLEGSVSDSCRLSTGGVPVVSILISRLK
jgi:hypothetical protein